VPLRDIVETQVPAGGVFETVHRVQTDRETAGTTPDACMFSDHGRLPVAVGAQIEHTFQSLCRCRRLERPVDRLLPRAVGKAQPGHEPFMDVLQLHCHDVFGEYHVAHTDIQPTSTGMESPTGLQAIASVEVHQHHRDMEHAHQFGGGDIETVRFAVPCACPFREQADDMIVLESLRYVLDGLVIAAALLLGDAGDQLAQQESERFILK